MRMSATCRLWLRCALLLLAIALGPACPVATALQFDLHYDPLAPTPPEMKAALVQALSGWETVLSDPVTVTLWIRYAAVSGGAAAGAKPNFYFGGRPYDDARAAMIADAQSYEHPLLSQLPTYAEFDAYYAPGWDKTMVSPLSITQANARALGYSFTPLLDDASITFDTATTWDYDPNDGVDTGIDFAAVAQHEVGHTLGFVSVVDYIDGVIGYPISLTPLDLLRFKAGDVTTDGFANAKRVVATGQTVPQQVVYDGERELGMCTGTNAGQDGFQASHYLPIPQAPDEEYLGIMIPVVNPPEQRITANDLRVLGLIGWDVAGWSDDTQMLWRGVGTGHAGTRWADPANWTPSAIPSKGYDVRIGLTEPGWVRVDFNRAYCGDLHVNSDGPLLNTGLWVEHEGMRVAELHADNIRVAESSPGGAAYYGSVRLVDGTIAVSANMVIGDHGVGDFVQSGGTNTVAGELVLGKLAGSDGTYELSGTGTLSAGFVSVGYRGAGWFEHSSGSHLVQEAVYLGDTEDGNGTYEISGSGSLVAAGLKVGVSGTGSFRHFGGTVSLAGPYTRTGGLHVGGGPTGEGAYELWGGELYVEKNEIVGHSGKGEFSHGGGLNRAEGGLTLGWDPDSGGTYALYGTGDLLASVIRVGRRGTGTFIHTAGANTVASGLYIGKEADSHGTYELSGTAALSVPTVNIGQVGTGTFTWTGGSLSANTINVGAHGTMTVGQDWTWDGTLNVVSGGTVDLGSHDLRVSDGGSVQLSGSGQLAASDEYVGREGVGTLTHLGGTHRVTNELHLGFASASAGTYELHGGELSAKYVGAGRAGSGVFRQTGGRNIISSLDPYPSGSLFLAEHPGSSGTYYLSGGELCAGKNDLATRGRACSGTRRELTRSALPCRWATTQVPKVHTNWVAQANW